ncbi:S1C family serine protease [Nocardioides currus]|uniref:Septum formation initiator n=1 Tax=Nocardioides currus TaxID=2133958 RepID=A0A2R7YSL8_9ACTN|nr:trypsin-like peptidase domain-containing protein [Nocardioides currus]PUA79405.1 septum formation initiator [Nocardioides currus]
MSLSRRITSSVAAAALALPTVAVAVPAAATPPISFVDRGWPGQSSGQPFGGQSYGGQYGATYGRTASIDATDATTEQSVGIVQISTVVDFDAGEAAGTGIVLDATADGGGALVVTNHHVVEGATNIEVTDPVTGETATAEVLGFDAVKDVAVLRVDSTSLSAVDTDTAGVDVGDAVVAVGDAGGDGGSLTAAAGTVTALRQRIDVTEDDGSVATLRRLIEVDSDIIPGDSGGALLAADGDVVGMNVAASSGSIGIDGYVIPMRRVLTVVDAVLAGDAGGTVTLGYSAFLGVGLSTSGGAATIGNVVAGSPAADAGLAAGDTVTALDGTAVTSPARLRRLVRRHQPGEQVDVTWRDTAGTSHSATVGLDRAPVA